MFQAAKHTQLAQAGVVAQRDSVKVHAKKKAQESAPKKSGRPALGITESFESSDVKYDAAPPAECEAPGTQIVARGVRLPFFSAPAEEGTAVLRRTGRPQRRDQKAVFVAGATGRLGARIVRELLSAGFTVRGGVRDVGKANEFLDLAKQYGLIAPEQARKLSFVQIDLRDPDCLPGAIGSASKVVCAVGASEGELSFGNTRDVDGDGTISLVQAAESVGVTRFVLVTSLGTGKLGFPASLLNLFGGILSQKKRAEGVLEDSKMSYTIIRPGGMEKPQDDHKDTHNLVFNPRDTTFKGTVSRLQIAETVAASFAVPTGLADNKVIEIVAETTAPPQSWEDLFSSVPAFMTQEEKLQAVAELESLTAQVGMAEEKLAELQESRADLIDQLKEAESAAKEASAEAAASERAFQAASSQLEQLESQLEAVVLDEQVNRALLTAAQAAKRDGRALSKEEQSIVTMSVTAPEEARKLEEEAAAKEAAAAAKAAEAQAAAEAKAAKAAAAAEAKAAKAAAAAEAPARKAAPRKAAPVEEVAVTPPAPATPAVKGQKLGTKPAIEEAAAIRAAEEKALAEKAAAIRAAEEKLRADKEAAAKAARVAEQQRMEKAAKEAEAAKQQAIKEREEAEKALAESARAVQTSPPPAPKPAPAAKPTPAPAAKATPAPAPTPAPAAASASIADNKAEAQAWIAGWKERKDAAPAPAPKAPAAKAPAPKAPAPKKAPTPKAPVVVATSAAEIAANKAEAQEWIAKWKSRASEGNSGSTPDNKAEAQAWIAKWKSRASEGGNGVAPDNKAEAQAWIAKWKSRVN